MRANGKNRGFTLIELLVVVGIISLLSSVIMAGVSQAKVRAQDTRRVQDLVQLRNALELYALSNGGNYVNVLVGQVPWNNVNSRSYTGGMPPICNAVPGGTSWPDLFKTSLNPYMPSLSIDPANGSTYCYAYVPNLNGKGAAVAAIRASDLKYVVAIVGSPDMSIVNTAVPGYRIGQLPINGGIYNDAGNIGQVLSGSFTTATFGGGSGS